MTATPVTFLNTLLPLTVVAGFAWAIPWLLSPQGNRSHRRLAITVAISALVLVLFSAIILAAATVLEGADPLGALRNAPTSTAWLFLQRSLPAALAWAPVLALTWFGLAQRIERLKGEDGMQERPE